MLIVAAATAAAAAAAAAAGIYKVKPSANLFSRREI